MFICSYNDSWSPPDSTRHMFSIPGSSDEVELITQPDEEEINSNVQDAGSPKKNLEDDLVHYTIRELPKLEPAEYIENKALIGAKNKKERKGSQTKSDQNSSTRSKRAGFFIELNESSPPIDIPISTGIISPSKIPKLNLEPVLEVSILLFLLLIPIYKVDNCELAKQ